jgi:hypothetical protein
MFNYQQTRDNGISLAKSMEDDENKYYHVFVLTIRFTDRLQI